MLHALNARYLSMEKRRFEMLAYLESLSDAERNKAPAPTDWSPLQIMEHVVTVEEWMAGPNAALPHENGKVLLKGHLFIMLGGGLTRVAVGLGFRIPTLPQAEPQGAHFDFTAIKRRWENARQSLLPKLEAVMPETRHLSIALHPIAGPLNAGQVVTLLDVHLAYHWRHFPRAGK